MDAMDLLNGATLKRPTTTLPQNLRVCAPDLSFTKKLKRMPHLFTRVLELPLHAETPVSVLESRDSFRFEVRLPGLLVNDVKVEVLEIVPGATKVLVRGVDSRVGVAEVDFWRFRLPPTTVPEKSAATYSYGILSVTIPKTLVPCNDNLDMQEKSDGEHSLNDHSGTDLEGETEEERMQREVLEDLESFGSPRRARSPSRSSSASPRALSRKDSESEIDQEKLQQAVLEDLECFGSPRRRSASCPQALNFAEQQRAGPHQDFFRSVGSWVGGFSVYVQ
ncbi:hypothetical protein M758_1G153700 [Ceratodon purpureus]|nr:hypothetical protein M758_1G153700 [Ceratodon purpureus]